MPGPRPLPVSTLTSLALLVILIGGAGCARSVYRRQADREAYDLINQKAERLDANADAWQLNRGEDSRLHDSTNPDHPAMPADDPAAHELMRTGSKSPDAQAVIFEEGWKQALPSTGKGTVVLNMHDAVEVAARNSHDFQRAREDLYLSALDLSEQRYEFRPHLAASTIGSRNEFGSKPGGQPKRNVRLDSEGSLSLLTAWGTDILTKFVNTIIWDFDQPKLRTATSLLNFSIVQPLMRFGGRARVLEPLTQSERHLLANVRRMEQYQQGFYLNIVAGRDPTDGPVRSVTATSSAPALLAGSPSGVAGVPGASGYMGLLEEEQRIHNLESNVAGLRSSLEQLEAAFDAGRVASLLQVLQARNALQSAQSSLLTARAAYETHIDSFKTNIGLPPNLRLVVRDSLLDRFSVFDPETTRLQNQINDIASRLHDHDLTGTPEALRATLAELKKLQPVFAARLASARRDVVAFSEALPEREAQLVRLRRRADVEALNLPANRFDPKQLRAKAVASEQNLGALQKSVEAAFAELAGVEADLAGPDFDSARGRVSTTASSLSGYVLQLTLDRAASRIESVTLSPADLDEVRAIEIAKTNRLDWMNARAELVDAWRKIDYEANPLMSGLDLKLDGDLGTTHSLGTHFDGRAGRLQGALQFDTPLDRLKERNNYREALVNYQRARRDYMTFEDHVSQSLRNTLRLMELGQINFELRRAAVQSALAEVDLARLHLDEPPKPGQPSQIGATTARDLVSALSDLLSAQNDFLSLWSGNQVLRMVLDYELGLMGIDHDGQWIEPGPFTKDQIARRLAQRPAAIEQLASNSPAKSKTSNTAIR